MGAPTIIYGAHGEALSTPQSRRLSTMQRQQASVQAKFDAAQTTTENSRYWANADYLGPNAELQAGIRRELRSRARYECANNSYASGIVRTLANDTIGTGPELQITDSRLSKDEAAFVEREFWDWCTAAGLPRKLRHMRLAKARDGEVFAMFFTNPGLAFDGPVQLDLRPFEADFVASTNYANSLTDLLDGIITDDFGNVVAYNVLREHPGDACTMIGEADLIPASLVIHLFHSDRPGAYRGCSELLSSLPLYAQLRRYTLAVLRAAESAAIPSWLLETQQPPSEMQFGDAFDTLETERGMGVTLPAGYKMSQLKAEHPTTTYPAFKREIVSETGRGAGVPYNINAGDSSSYNYSSGRLDHRTYYKALRVERSYWEPTALRPILRNWWLEARKSSNYLPQAARERLPVHNWRWDGDEHVDPTKEADATVTRVAYGLTALTDEVAGLGGDIEVIQRKNAEALGLPIEEYRKRLADKFFGAQIASSSQELPEPSTSNPIGGDANA